MPEDRRGKKGILASLEVLPDSYTQAGTEKVALNLPLEDRSAGVVGT
jgi:hypothetical protein